MPIQKPTDPLYVGRVMRSRGRGRPSLSDGYIPALTSWYRASIAEGHVPSAREAHGWLASQGVSFSIGTVHGMLVRVRSVDRVHAGGHWLSFDPGARAGLALWDGVRLSAVGLVVRGPQGAFLDAAGGDVGGLLHGVGHAFASFERLLGQVVRASLPRLAVCERGFGANVQVKVGHAWQRGVMAGLLNSVRGRAVDVATDVWRKALVPEFGAWPRGGPALKAHAVAAVEATYRCTVGPDEADAVLLGRAALALGLVPKAVLVAGASAPPADPGDAAESLIEIARRDASESGMD